MTLFNIFLQNNTNNKLTQSYKDNKQVWMIRLVKTRMKQITCQAQNYYYQDNNNKFTSDGRKQCLCLAHCIYIRIKNVSVILLLWLIVNTWIILTRRFMVIIIQVLTKAIAYYWMCYLSFMRHVKYRHVVNHFFVIWMWVMYANQYNTCYVLYNKSIIIRL